MRVCAGDGTVHRVSRATLEKCKYFGAKLARWESDLIELDVDDDSLRVILTLLRYGPLAIPRLDAARRAKLAKDADYLGVPSELWIGFMVGPAPEGVSDRVRAWEESGQAHLDTCHRCSQPGRRSQWRCVSCSAPVDERNTVMLFRERAGHGRAHECARCGIDYVKMVRTCLVCGDSGGP